MRTVAAFTQRVEESLLRPAEFLLPLAKADYDLHAGLGQLAGCFDPAIKFFHALFGAIHAFFGSVHTLLGAIHAPVETLLVLAEQRANFIEFPPDLRLHATAVYQCDGLAWPFRKHTLPCYNRRPRQKA